MSTESYKPIKESEANQEEAVAESEVIANPEEEYGTLEMLFTIERLNENLESVKEQLNNIRGLIEKYQVVLERHKNDPGVGASLDEYRVQIVDAFETFKINNKTIDITKLVDGQFEDVYNDIILGINDYVQDYMIGSGEESLDTV